VLEPARRALQLLEGNNARSVRVPYVYVTNGGGPSETERAALLQRELGVPVSITAVEDWGAGLAKGCPTSAAEGGAGL
jgi:ribonucleotide monophosphatase NagD (HAD superfamily)